MLREATRPNQITTQSPLDLIKIRLFYRFKINENNFFIKYINLELKKESTMRLTRNVALDLLY